MRLAGMDEPAIFAPDKITVTDRSGERELHQGYSSRFRPLRLRPGTTEKNRRLIGEV
jgi:hypothetical protein